LATRKIGTTHSDLILENIHIAREREPIRILGAYFGYNLNEEEIWKPTVEKIKAALKRWEKLKPTIRGRCNAANSVIGGFTQYLTRAQGMPRTTLATLNRLMDDFVYAKKGERKTNRISIDFLRKSRDLGGLKLIDLEARNEAIELMKAKDFFQPEQSRPLWAKLTDKILAENAVRKYKDRVGVNNLIHPILQTWRIHLNSAQLPDSQKRMMRVA
jgi:hypothetical protein